MKKIFLAAFLFIILVILIIRVKSDEDCPMRSDESRIKLLCQIRFANNESLLFLTEDTFWVKFIRIDRAEYNYYTQKLMLMKKKLSGKPDQLNDSDFVPNEFYYKFTENRKAYSYFNKICIKKEDIRKPFKMRLKEGCYVVEILQKGYVYFNCINLKYDFTLNLLEDDIYLN